MRNSKYREAQIVAILQEAEAGPSVAEVLRPLRRLACRLS
jgi:hypothetical protein